MKLSREDVAWAAGFYEGEGSINYSISHKGGKSYSGGIYIPQCNIEPLEKFQNIFNVGHISSTFDKRYPNSQILFIYAITDRKHVQFVAAAIWDFLSAKRKDQVYNNLLKIKNYYDSGAIIRGLRCRGGHNTSIDDNVWIHIRKDGSQQRQCKLCRRDKALEKKNK